MKLETKSNRSTVKNLEKEEEMRDILISLGIKPSDIFFAEKLLFVEGESDRRFFEKLSIKLNMPLFKYGIAVYPLGGASKGKRHLDMWNTITKDVRIPKFFVLDKDAENEANDLRQKDPSVNIHVLEKGELEDYYPGSLILEGIQAITNTKFSEEEVKKYKEIIEKEKKKIKAIFRILGEKGFLDQKEKESKEKEFRWKIQLAEYVSKNIKKKDIPSEIKKVITNVVATLR